jgi:hypothetical protein
MAFFSEMENNIRNKLKRGEGALDMAKNPVPAQAAGATSGRKGALKRNHLRGRSQTEERSSRSTSPGIKSLMTRSATVSHGLTPPRTLFRTISSIDSSAVEEQLKSLSSGTPQQQVHHRGGSEASHGTVGVVSIGSTTDLDAVLGEIALGDAPQIGAGLSPLKRRNSTSTLYLGAHDTMSNPDKDATIMSVCAVYRAHLLEAEAAAPSPAPPLPSAEKYSIFDDGDVYEDFPLPPNLERTDTVNRTLNVPSLDEVSNFFRSVFHRSNLNVDCIILSLCYVERLIKATEGNLAPRATNWRSLLMAVLLLSSKVWDDLACWNSDFCQHFPMYTISRINALELAVLNALSFDVKVTCGEYAKYYFALRTMSARSGLSDPTAATALDVSSAHRLQEATQKFGEQTVKQALRLTKSTTIGSGEDSKVLEQLSSEGYKFALKKHTVNVSIEQLVRMETPKEGDD